MPGRSKRNRAKASTERLQEPQNVAERIHLVHMRGARCETCALGELHRRGGTFAPVPGENIGARLAFVGVYPGAEDHLRGRPHTGTAGQYTQEALGQFDVHRHHLAWTYAIACPPVLSWDYTVGRMRAVRKDRPEMELPLEACAPRLRKELWPAEHVILAGREPIEVLSGVEGSMTELHGSLIYGQRAVDAQGQRAATLFAPVVSPTTVLRRMRWDRAYRHALGRALAWFRGEHDWEEPEQVGYDPVHPPSYEEIDRIFTDWESRPVIIGYDTETNALDPLRARLRTIQLASTNKALVLPIRTMEPRETSSAKHYPFFYQKDELIAILERTAAFMNNLDKPHRFVGLNCWVYDNPVLEAESARFRLSRPLVPARRAFDLLGAHRIIDGEMPHSLAFQGQHFTSVIAWKASGRAAQTDRAGFAYGGTDAVVTARIYPQLRPLLTADDGGGPDGPKLFNHDGELAEACAGMRKLGYHIDQKERARLTRHYQGLADRSLRAFGEALAAGKSRFVDESGRLKNGFNPNSSEDLRELLFKDWELPPPKDLHVPYDEAEDHVAWMLEGMKTGFLTKTGKESTGLPILVSYIAQAEHEKGLLEPWQVEALHALRMYKKAAKLISDKLNTARLLDPDQYDRDGYPKLYKSGGKWPVTAVWADGVLRTGWKLGPPIGRLASGDPFNLQNVNKMLRTMFVAAAGHVLVGLDFEQVHLFIIANLWKIPSLVDDFKNKRDVHTEMARRVVTGWDQLLAASGGNPKANPAAGARNTGKQVRYTGAYGGSPSAIHAVVQKAADPETWQLLNLRTAFEEIEAIHTKWMKVEPEWRLSWRRELEAFEAKGYVEDGFGERRAYFRDGTDLYTKVPNARVLMTEQAIAGRAMRRVVKRIPFGCWSPQTGLVEQCHDALVVQVPKERAEEAARILSECCRVEDPGGGFDYWGVADIGVNRKQVA